MPTPSRDVTVLQGGTNQGDMIFGHGPVAGLSSFDGVEAILSDVELCGAFETGTVVHIVGKDSFCKLYQATFDVVGVADCTLSLALKCGALPQGTVTEAYVSQAADLNGFNLYGVVSSNSPGQRGTNLTGCIAAGSNQLVLAGDVPALPNDAADLPSGGIEAATVLSVAQVLNGATVTHTVLTLDQSATSTVACSAPSPATVSAKRLASFDFSIDPDCGRATYRLNSSFALSPSALCCSSCVLVGCYEIVLVAGAVPPANYPPGDYISWAKVVASGQLYAQQSLSLVS